MMLLHPHCPSADDTLTMCCPSCGQREYMDIQCSPAWSTLDASGEWEDYGSHDYDGNSPAYCNDCGHHGIVDDFLSTIPGD